MKLTPADFNHLNSFYGRSGSRTTVYRLYKGVCQGCANGVDASAFHVGHIVPQSHREEFENWFPGLDVDNLLNLHLLCARCNLKQSNFFIESPFRLNQLFAQSAAAIARRLERISPGEELPADGIEKRVQNKLQTMGHSFSLPTADIEKMACAPAFHLVPANSLRKALGEHRFSATLTAAQLAVAFSCGLRVLSVPHMLVARTGGCFVRDIAPETADVLEQFDDWRQPLKDGQVARVLVSETLWDYPQVAFAHFTDAEHWAQHALARLSKFRAAVSSARGSLYEVEFGSSELPEALEPFDWARAASQTFCGRQMLPEFAGVDAGVDRKGRRLVYSPALASLPKNLRSSAEQLVKDREVDVGLLTPRLSLLRAIDNCLEFGMWALDNCDGQLGMAVEPSYGRSAAFPAIAGLAELVDRRFEESSTRADRLVRRGRPRKS